MKIKQEMNHADTESHRTDLMGKQSKQSRQCGFLGRGGVGRLCCFTAAAGIVLLQRRASLGKSKRRCTHSVVSGAQL